MPVTLEKVPFIAPETAEYMKGTRKKSKEKETPKAIEEIQDDLKSRSKLLAIRLPENLYKDISKSAIDTGQTKATWARLALAWFYEQIESDALRITNGIVIDNRK
jgi:hypothetical protein